MDEETPRGPKGGKKHTPGRDHDGKSAKKKKKRFARKQAEKRREQEERARNDWVEWDSYTDEQRRLLWPYRPKMPRPSDEE
jgi:hypothetical protein